MCAKLVKFAYLLEEEVCLSCGNVNTNPVSDADGQLYVQLKLLTDKEKFYMTDTLSLITKYTVNSVC